MHPLVVIAGLGGVGYALFRGVEEVNTTAKYAVGLGALYVAYRVMQAQGMAK